MKSTRSGVIVALIALFFPLMLWAASGPLNPEFERLETMYSLPKGILAKTCFVESGCRNIPNPDGGAVGMFQFMPKTFDGMIRKVFKRAACLGRYNNCSGVDERYDPVLSAQMTAIMYADARAQVGGLIQKAGMDMIPGLYLTHFFGVGGATRFIQLFMQNRNAAAAPYFGNGAARTASGQNRGVFYSSPKNPCANRECTFAEIYNATARKMGAAPVTTNATGDVTGPDGISRVLSGFNPSNYFGPLTMSQFPADPVRTYMAADSGTLGVSSVQPAQPTSADASAASTSAISFKESFLLLVQPSEVRVGQNIIVSWTSVGMQPSSCKATYGGAEVATGNEATKFVPASIVGTVEFVLTCTTQAGTSVEKRATVQIRQ